MIEPSAFRQVPDGPSPIYSRIVEQMRQRICDLKLAPGTRLPTEPNLSRHFGVSIITIRAALRELASEGIIERQQGRGTFVRSSVPRQTEWALGTVEDLAATSRLSQVEIVRHGMRVAPRWAAMLLGAQPGSAAFNVKVIRRQSKTPFVVTDAYFPPDVSERLVDRDVEKQLAQNPLVIGLAEETMGMKVTAIRQTIAAAKCDAALAAFLRVQRGTPVLVVTRASRSTSGRVLQVARSHYRSNGFSYTVHVAQS